jgi:hypothetical protein
VSTFQRPFPFTKGKIDDSYRNAARQGVTTKKKLSVRFFEKREGSSPYKNCRQPVFSSAHYMAFGQMIPGSVGEPYVYTRGKLKI